MESWGWLTNGYRMARQRVDELLREARTEALLHEARRSAGAERRRGASKALREDGGLRPWWAKLVARLRRGGLRPLL